MLLKQTFLFPYNKQFVKNPILCQTCECMPTPTLIQVYLDLCVTGKNEADNIAIQTYYS